MRRFAVVLALGMAACAAPPTQPLRPPTDIRRVSPTFLEEQLARRRASSVTMKIYNTGSVRAQGNIVSSMKSRESRVKLDVPVFLIRHPRGLVLFDTGISTDTARRLNREKRGFELAFEAEPGRDAATQLREDHVSPEAVGWIILSHLALDHAGLVDRFPKATLVVSRREWGWQKSRVARKDPAAAFGPAAYEGRRDVRLVDFSTAPPLGTFDHAVDLFSDGSIFLLDLPGHTPGSMGAWANLDGGPVLLAGDAVWVVDNYLDLAPPIPQSMADRQQYWGTINRIHAMQEIAPRLVIFPGHDLTPRMLSTRDDLPLAP